MNKQFTVDDELLDKIANGDEIAYNTFLKRYVRFSRRLVKEFLTEHPYFEFIFDDLHSIVLCGTPEIISKYDKEKGMFYPFWKKVSLRNLSFYLKENYYLPEGNNGFVSLDYVPEENHALHETIGEDDVSMENNLLYDALLAITTDPRNDFKRREKEVFKLFLDNYTYQEIADKLDISIPSVYRVINHAVEKISKVLKDPNK